MPKRSTKISNFIPIAAGAGLLGLAGALLYAPVQQDANATVASVTNTVNLPATVEVQRVIALSASLSDFTFNSSTLGSLITHPLEITVRSTAEAGYNLTFSDDNTDTSLYNGTMSRAIDSITEDVTAESFPTNKWGYSVDSGANFKAIPSVETPVDLTNVLSLAGANTASEDTISTLYIGAKVDGSTSAGQYTDVLRITAVTNEIADSFDTITYMQDMTAAICNAVATPSPSATDIPTRILIDNRDNKQYTVRKLADGNCWMVSNLAFTPTLGTTYTSSDTDVTSSFSITASDSAYPTDIAASLNNGSILQKPGANSSSVVKWGDGDNETASSQWHIYDNTNANYGGNASYGYLYNWYAATAGTGTWAQTSDDASSSLCPVGWQLPTSTYSAATASTARGSYRGLLAAYSSTDEANSSYLLYGHDFSTEAAWSGDHRDALTAAPLSFVRSGNYNLDNGYPQNQATNIFLWSATATSATYASSLVSGSSGTLSQHDARRGGAVAVRCVARRAV